MCGIFGIMPPKDKNISDVISKKEFDQFLIASQRRGRDSSGYVTLENKKIKIIKRDIPLTKVLNFDKIKNTPFCFGHSRLITNGLKDNQPVILDKNILVHNGIIVNHEEVFKKNNITRKFKLDSEAIISIFNDCISKNITIEDTISKIFKECYGTISSVIYSTDLNKMILFSNNGSLYKGLKNDALFFSSEEYPLKEMKCHSIKKVFKPVIYDLGYLNQVKESEIVIDEKNSRNLDLIPKLGILNGDEKLLEYKTHNLKRCTKCVLPETMPFITFDQNGVCNYCNNYKIRNNPKPFSVLEKLVEPYRKKVGDDCIIPFSGGRDSCFGLHLAVRKLGLKPITYTYDWGMVTDLARRNISRFCAELGVENIIVADNIEWKRKNVRKNIKAWLKYPDLGMVNIFTAGDKHFFRHVQDVKKQTGIPIDLWSVNPMEVTHFKSGFMGVKPDFEEDKVYSNGWMKQLKYHSLRFKSMLKSPSYFNSTIFDTLQGEYYRSFLKKKDYFHIFDFYEWDEEEINKTIIDEYDFEMAPDTPTTWRIGDGTAAFYNYIYYTISGLSEHDTFRSNQIREGQISREKALLLIKEENRPRYQNIAWYLQAVGLNYHDVIKTINRAEKLY